VLGAELETVKTLPNPKLAEALGTNTNAKSR
jgi:hypothetical protein